MNKKLKPGDKFYNLTVVEHISRYEGYLVKCDCGKITKARSWSMRSGKHKSCGCKARQEQSKRQFKAGWVGVKGEILRNYQKSAKKRNIEFLLEKKHFFNLLDGNCIYCGIEPQSNYTYGKKNTIVDYSQFKYNGVDRINNTKGYINGNVGSCCKICNNSKSTLTVSDWLVWISRVTKNIEFIESSKFNN